MANRFWYEKVRSLLVGRADISGSFGPNGTSAVDPASINGKGFTVARTSAGVFTVTLADRYAKLLAANCSLQLATGDDKFVQLGPYVAASHTIQIRVWDASGAAPADVTADPNNRIHFNLILTVSGVD